MTQQEMILGWVLIAIGMVLLVISPRIRSWQWILGVICMMPGIYVELAYFTPRGR